MEVEHAPPPAACRGAGQDIEPATEAGGADQHAGCARRAGGREGGSGGAGQAQEEGSHVDSGKTLAPSYRSLASLQQGSTLQLLPYYPVVGEEAENKMRYAIIAQKPAPIPSIDIPLRFR